LGLAISPIGLSLAEYLSLKTSIHRQAD